MSHFSIESKIIPDSQHCHEGLMSLGLSISLYSLVCWGTQTNHYLYLAEECFWKFSISDYLRDLKIYVIPPKLSSQRGMFVCRPHRSGRQHNACGEMKPTGNNGTVQCRTTAVITCCNPKLCNWRLKTGSRTVSKTPVSACQQGSKRQERWGPAAQQQSNFKIRLTIIKSIADGSVFS